LVSATMPPFSPLPACLPFLVRDFRFPKSGDT
jgi:hypothetical protein